MYGKDKQIHVDRQGDGETSNSPPTTIARLLLLQIWLEHHLLHITYSIPKITTGICISGKRRYIPRVSDCDKNEIFFESKGATSNLSQNVFFSVAFVVYAILNSRASSESRKK